MRERGVGTEGERLDGVTGEGREGEIRGGKFDWRDDWEG